MSRIKLLAGLIALRPRRWLQSPDHSRRLTPHSTVASRFWFARSSTCPQDYNVIIGARKPSNVPGSTRCPSPFSRGSKSTPVDFLISTDGKTLARLETFDLAKNPALSIDVSGRPVRGNPAAKVTVINFDDLECPYCARMHQSLFPSTLDRYKDKVRFIYKDDPLSENHPWAIHAAVDANCLAAQNAATYWTFVDYLHSHGQEVSGEDRSLPKELCCARSHRTPGRHSCQVGQCQTRRLPDETGRSRSQRIETGSGKLEIESSACPLCRWRANRWRHSRRANLDRDRSRPARRWASSRRPHPQQPAQSAGKGQVSSLRLRRIAVSSHS